MADPLPPLNALRAFDAAARHLSFKKAAEEMHVTPAAVGHQVKVLEEFLGVALFRRLNRAVALTDAGQACLPDLREAFDRISTAVDRVRALEKRHVLVANVVPSFAVKWLVPRLTRFQDRHPQITVRIETTTDVVDPVRDGVDVAIRYCDGVERNLRGEILFGEEVAPVCAPELLEGTHPLGRPDDLRHHTLIHLAGGSTDPSYPTWEAWLRGAGVNGIDVKRGLHFSQTLTAAQAALDGQGVALLGQTCLLDDLAAGRLIRPFTLGFTASFACWLVCPGALFDQSKVRAFRTWLREEAQLSLRGAASAMTPIPKPAGGSAAPRPR